jgi:hypothetical protein
MQHLTSTIIELPFHVTLVGYRGRVDGECFGAVGKRLMDRMWAEIRQLGLANRGLNHWVYLPDSQMFTGVELTGACDQLGSLEQLDVSLNRHLRYVHTGPYTELPAVWQQLRDELTRRGETCGCPSLEIYGHWNDDPQKCETTILIGLAEKLS